MVRQYIPRRDCGFARQVTVIKSGGVAECGACKDARSSREGEEEGEAEDQATGQAQHRTDPFQSKGWNAVTKTEARKGR